MNYNEHENSLTITNSVFSGNKAVGSGGGIAHQNYSPAANSLTLQGVRMFNNRYWLSINVLRWVVRQGMEGRSFTMVETISARWQSMVRCSKAILLTDRIYGCKVVQ